MSVISISIIIRKMNFRFQTKFLFWSGKNYLYFTKTYSEYAPHVTIIFLPIFCFC